MGRPKKNYRPLYILMDLKISDQLNDYCEATGLTKTTAVEIILRDYFRNHPIDPEDQR